MKKARSFIILFGLITALLIAGGCTKKTETAAAEHPLNKQFMKLIDTYVNALKKGDVKVLQESVHDAAYAMYSPGQLEKQKEYFGEIKTWELDKTQAPYINTDANQAIYRIIIKSKLRDVTLDIDIRPYFNFGWRIYAIKPVKIQRLIPESHKKYTFPTGSDAANTSSSTEKSTKDTVKK